MTLRELPTTERRILTDDDGSWRYCDCGLPAFRLCSAVQPEGITLVRCQLPICGVGAVEGWCDKHRHQSGTMGYMGQSRLSASYEGEDSDGGFLDGLRAWWSNTFWSNEHRAQVVWERIKAQEFKPPRPLPDEFKLNIKGHIFELRGNTMVLTNPVSPLEKR